LVTVILSHWLVTVLSPEFLNYENLNIIVPLINVLKMLYLFGKFVIIFDDF